jgi:hypothetical protein
MIIVSNTSPIINLAKELQDLLRAENIPVERRRQDPNSLNWGEILALAMKPASHI